MTYMVCPAIVAHDELDSLDAQTTPQALHAGELGETYVTRVKGGDGGDAKRKRASPDRSAQGPSISTVGPTFNGEHLRSWVVACC
mmetsp:Transcript_44292/g.77262  ORF Transcript_44292/g.77262 Transcript_44292/m.77262 type:complete len:85 (-) Transcript_44292:39-293(-)